MDGRDGIGGSLSSADERRALWQARSDHASFPQRAITTTHPAGTAVDEISLTDLAILFLLSTAPLIFALALLSSGMTDAFSTTYMTLGEIFAYTGRLTNANGVEITKVESMSVVSKTRAVCRMRWSVSRNLK